MDVCGGEREQLALSESEPRTEHRQHSVSLWQPFTVRQNLLDGPRHDLGAGDRRRTNRLRLARVAYDQSVVDRGSKDTADIHEDKPTVGRCEWIEGDKPLFDRCRLDMP